MGVLTSAAKGFCVEEGVVGRRVEGRTRTGNRIVAAGTLIAALLVNELLCDVCSMPGIESGKELSVTPDRRDKLRKRRDRYGADVVARRLNV